MSDHPTEAAFESIVAVETPIRTVRPKDRLMAALPLLLAAGLGLSLLIGAALGGYRLLTNPLYLRSLF